MSFKDKELLDKVFEVQEKIADLHPCLKSVYPIAIAEGSELVVYDITPNRSHYHMATRVTLPMELPDKLRAAFPIEDYGNRPACVVTRDVFETLEGYTTIFHEFAHCYQFAQFEQEVRQSLPIALEAKARGDFMWELFYPFPYGHKAFCDQYLAMVAALEDQNSSKVFRCRAALKGALHEGAFQYMVWQEWKEGFARFVENRIQRRLGLPQNLGGGTPPFQRTIFYAGGASLIEFFSVMQPSITSDLRQLFDQLMKSEAR